MAEPFMSEIRLMSFNFPPKGWAFCNGQTLPINQNQALFALLGTRYGGNGQTNFQLPNFQGRVPTHVGGSFSTGGQAGGESAHTLTGQEMPKHNHGVNVNSAGGTTQVVAGNFIAGGTNVYHAPTQPVPMRPTTIANAGGSQPHTNQQPYLAINFCIALQGIFPSQN